jgi:hypothetical protein
VGSPAADLGARRRRAGIAAVALAAAAVVGVALAGPIPQDPAYHAFADHATRLGVRNAADVLSNVAFLVVGLVLIARGGRTRDVPAWERRAFLAYGVGVLLTAFGSAYYHLDPRHETLVWDRLTMTVAFTAFFALVLGERLGAAVGRRALVPLLAVGIASVATWAATLAAIPGGDLRAYVVVKYVPPAVALLLLALVPEPRATRGPVLWTLLLMAAATAFELLDAPVHEATGGVVSGHTLKHLVAAAACATPLVWFARRRSLPA